MTKPTQMENCVNADRPRASAFVISLDFELIWGVRDHATRESYGTNVLGARQAIPRMLDLFERFGVRGTWATVGFLFADGKEDLLQYLPEADLRPRYDHAALSNYGYFDELGESEAADPYAFAPSLIARIAETPGQEIATHTMSHFYCLEKGPQTEAFRADLIAAGKIASARGVALKSIVFPRNQYSDEHLAICAEQGLRVYRGNAKGAAYRPSAGSEEIPMRRLKRLIDAHTGCLGSQVQEIGHRQGCLNVPASMFLRPASGRLAFAHPLHVRQVMLQMHRAAIEGRLFHLWWHPHNFGVAQDANMAALTKILEHFAQVRETFGMQSMAMGDVA
jgi:peptidoglycan/xylan/chitin deacetylase (PgdA/CDA1 family)